MRRYLWVVMLCLVYLSGIVYGQVSIKTYQGLKAKGELGNEWLQTYISGLGRGFMWMNTALEYRGQPRMFCAPPHLPLGAHTFIDVLDGELKRSSMSDEMPIEMPIELALLNGLKYTFPRP
jgi:hypothetical protein